MRRRTSLQTEASLSGGGGLGGSSVGVFLTGAAPGTLTEIGSTYSLGLPGAGGRNGSGLSVAANGLSSNQATVGPYIPALISNLAPTATHTIIFTSESTISVATPALTADPDIGDTFTIAKLTDPANGIAAVIGNQLVYAPSAGFTGVDAFAYSATDGGGNFVSGYAVAFVSPATPCPADIDNDGMVSGSDLAILLASWGPCP